MKLAVVFMLGSLVVVLGARYDNINIEAILGNDRVLQSYIKCLLDQGPCTPEGRDLRDQAPEAVRNACANCNDKQRSLVRKASLFLIQNKPREWELLEKKYDPERAYHEAFTKFLETKS